jgi:arylsulfatase A-like enzyme
VKQSILTGLSWGVAAWLVYGAVELALSLGAQLVQHQDLIVLRWQWRLIALVFGVYGLAGILAGGTVGALLAWTGRKQGSGAIAAAASLTLVLAFIVNLVLAGHLTRSESMALAVALVLGIGCVAALSSEARAEQVGFLARPLTASLLLLCIPWLNLDVLTSESSSNTRNALPVLLALAIAGTGALIWRLCRGHARSAMRSATSACAIFLITLVAAQYKSRIPSVHADSGALASALGKPNVLLITMDTVRADHLSVYGYSRDTTPNLIEFARTATVYNRSIAAWDATLPAHATIFTGMYPSWHGAFYARPEFPYGRPLPVGHATLAEVLGSSGYWTAESAANYSYLAAWAGLTRGFATVDVDRPAVLATVERPFYLRAGVRRWLELALNVSGFDRRTLTAEDINERALALLPQAGAGRRPFFLFINYMDAHSPYIPKAPFDAQFPGRNPYFNAQKRDKLFRSVNDTSKPLSASEYAHLVSQYDGGIAEEDASLGSLFNRLRELSLFDNTLIIVTADHGEVFGEHGLLEHALGFTCEGLVRTPLIIKYPGQHLGSRVYDLVSQADLMPTILEAVGVAQPDRLQGESLLRPLNEAREVYVEAVSGGGLVSKNPRFKGFRRSIFAGSLKLTTWTEGPPEFYDLAADPDEAHNLYSPGDPRAVDLEKRLENWVGSIPKQQWQRQNLDKSTLERLKSLGYVQ